jgi:hypothetical protein
LILNAGLLQQKHLLLAIIDKLDTADLRCVIGYALTLDLDATTGHGFTEQCDKCRGKVEGDADDHSFVHDKDCVILLISDLRRATWQE